MLFVLMSYFFLSSSLVNAALTINAPGNSGQSTSILQPQFGPEYDSWTDENNYAETTNYDEAGNGDHHPTEEENDENSCGDTYFRKANPHICDVADDENGQQLGDDSRENFEQDGPDCEGLKGEARNTCEDGVTNLGGRLALTAKEQAEAKAKAEAEARRLAKVALNQELIDEERKARRNCFDKVLEIRSACSNLTAGTFNSGGGGNNLEQCKSAKADLQKTKGEHNTQKGACNRLDSELSNSCPTSVSAGPVTRIAEVNRVTGSGEAPRDSKDTDFSKLVNSGEGTVQKIISEINTLNSQIDRSIRGIDQCIAKFTNKPSPNQKVAGTNPTNPTNPTTPVTPPGSTPLTPVPPTTPDRELGGGSGGSGLLSSLAGIAGGLLNKEDSPSNPSTPELRPSASLPFNNAQFSGEPISKTGGSLNGRSGREDDLPDENILRDQNNNNSQFNSNANANAANAVPTSGNNTRAQLVGGGGAGNVGGTGGPRRRGRRNAGSVKERNIISGYKKVKPGDGGGSLSIRPKAFKKFGKAGLKTKLADARKKFGKKVPLIFKNGKFVLDFLALKEKKGFKSRQAAMEGYWKGERTPSASQACNPDECHQNEKLNLFKIMNFRFQKEFSTVKIDI